MKKNLILLFLFLFSIGYSQNNTKKIKEEYIETTDLFDHKKNEFTEFNLDGESIATGEWEFDTNKNYKKTRTRKIYTELEREYQYAYDKNHNIISKTQYYKEGSYAKPFIGAIKYYEILQYSPKNKLYKSTKYYAQIDTSDAGREQMNEDWKAYRAGSKSISPEYVTYDLKKNSIEQFNEKGELVQFLDLYDLDGVQYSYDDSANVVSYTKYEFKSHDAISMWELKLQWFNVEERMFRDENIEGEYTVTYKYDEFGNWIEKKTMKKDYDYKKEIRHIVYF